MSEKKIFCTSALNKLLRDKTPTFENITKFEKTYKNYFDYHKYEYIFKNEFTNLYINQILNDEVKLLYELEIYENDTLINILDLLLITDSSALAVEIKSDYDSPQRLARQLPTYSRLFQYVSIFVSEEKLDIYKEYLEHMEMNNIGIIVLTPTSIRTERNPLSNNLDQVLLTHNIKKLKPHLPIDELDMDRLYKTWLNNLYYAFNVDKKFLTKMPRSLKFYAYSHGFMKPLKKARFLRLFSN